MKSEKLHLLFLYLHMFNSPLVPNLYFFSDSKKTVNLHHFSTYLLLSKYYFIYFIINKLAYLDLKLTKEQIFCKLEIKIHESYPVLILQTN